MNHQARIDLASMTTELVCNAPLDSICHAQWDCECESWPDQGIEGGRAWHETHDGETHWTTLNLDYCIWRDWFESDDEPLNGTVTVDITPRWEVDYAAFDLADSPTVKIGHPGDGEGK